MLLLPLINPSSAVPAGGSKNNQDVVVFKLMFLIGAFFF